MVGIDQIPQFSIFGFYILKWPAADNKNTLQKLKYISLDDFCS
jgi:hypothetical protein